MPNVSVQGRDASQDHNHTYILCFSFEGKIPICVMCDLCYWLTFLAIVQSYIPLHVILVYNIVVNNVVSVL